jgi:hypothetical protein
MAFLATASPGQMSANACLSTFTSQLDNNAGTWSYRPCCFMYNAKRMHMWPKMEFAAMARGLQAFQCTITSCKGHHTCIVQVHNGNILVRKMHLVTRMSVALMHIRVYDQHVTDTTLGRLPCFADCQEDIAVRAPPAACNAHLQESCRCQHISFARIMPLRVAQCDADCRPEPNSWRFLRAPQVQWSAFR